MSSERTGAGHRFACDTPGCGNTWDPPRVPPGSAPRDFHDSFEDAKEEGWRAVKMPSRNGRNPTWEHRCGVCARP